MLLEEVFSLIPSCHILVVLSATRPRQYCSISLSANLSACVLVRIFMLGKSFVGNAWCNCLPCFIKDFFLSRYNNLHVKVFASVFPIVEFLWTPFGSRLTILLITSVFASQLFPCSSKSTDILLIRYVPTLEVSNYGIAIEPRR